MQTDDVTLYNILAGTMEADKTTREAAEHTLNELSSSQPEIVCRLIQFACQEVEASAAKKASPILLAAAIRVRNVLSKSDWNRNKNFTEPVKATVREMLIPYQCAPHVPELVRRQLLSATCDIMGYDFPQRWPTLMTQTNEVLDHCVAQVRAVLQTPETQRDDSMQRALHSVLLHLKGGLGVLRGCCKLYEDPLKVDAEEVDRFASQCLPSLVSLFEMLFQLWTGELHRLLDLFHGQKNNKAQASGAPQQPQASARATMDPFGDFDEQLMSMGGGEHLFDFSVTLSEVSHCMRLTYKCMWSFLASRWPLCWCDEAAFRSFWMNCVDGVFMSLLHAVCPLTRAAIELAPVVDLGDHFATFQVSPVWRMCKWMTKLIHKLTQEFAAPKACERRARGVAAIFEKGFLTGAATQSLELVRWHASPILLTSKAYIMSLETVDMIVTHKRLYTTLLHPHAEELVTMLLFPRLCFSDADMELWESNPEEYVRKQTNPVGDLYNAKVVSCSLMMSLTVPTKPYHDKNLLAVVVNFLMNQLQAYSANASRTTMDDFLNSQVVMVEAARRVDAAFYFLYHFKNVLLSMGFGDDKLEYVLTHQVVPALGYPLGFLRARAVLVLSVYAPRIQWSSPEAYQAALQGVLPLLNDSEAPVQVQTCTCLSRLIRHAHARAVVTPCIAQVIQHYFQVMRMIDNEAVVRTLRKTIAFYHDTLAQWALHLADMIVNHFATVLQNVTGRYDVLANTSSNTAQATCGNARDGSVGGMLEEDDEFGDVLLVAEELMETLTTLVKSLPTSAYTIAQVQDARAHNNAAALAEVEQRDLFVQLQHKLEPMLFVILSYQGGSTYGFMDPTLNLLTTLIARSPMVAAPLWRLVPCLHALVTRHGAVDYFGLMLPPLDNLASVEPVLFLFSSLSSLCEVPANVLTVCAGGDVTAAEAMSSYTPTQFVQLMCEAVLQEPSLRQQEVAAVPNVYASLMQSYWSSTRHVGALQSAVQTAGETTSVASAGLLLARTVPGRPDVAAHQGDLDRFVHYVGVQMLTLAGTRPRQMNTFRLLIANAVLSCMLADAEATFRVLQEMQCTQSFLEQYVYLVMHKPALQTSMRRYDRSLFVLAFAASVVCVGELLSRSQNQPEEAALAQAMQTVLCGVVESGVLQLLAEAEVATTEAEVHVLTKRRNKLVKQQEQRATGEAAALGEDDEDDEWDDEEDSDSEEDDGGWIGGEDDDDDDALLDDDDDDMEEVWNQDAEGAAARWDTSAGLKSDSHLQSMLRQAQTMRQGGKKKGGAASGLGDLDDNDAEGDFDDDEDDNLLEEEGFTSAIDGINAWEMIVQLVSMPGAVSHPVLARLQDPQFVSQASAVVAAQEQVSSLLSIQRELNEL